MKIAFDVKGTLEGHKGEQIRKILTTLRDAGHDVVVWSNSFFYAEDCVKTHDLRVPYQSKKTTWDCYGDESQFVDIAFEDDRSQTYLAAKRFIFVDEVPKEQKEFDEFLQNLILELT